MDVAVLDDARDEREARLARLTEQRGEHPLTRWLGHILDNRAHRRIGDDLACGAPAGALVAADDPDTPPCTACFPC